MKITLFSFNTLGKKKKKVHPYEKKETFNIAKDSESLYGLYKHQPFMLTQLGNGIPEFL